MSVQDLRYPPVFGLNVSLLRGCPNFILFLIRFENSHWVSYYRVLESRYLAQYEVFFPLHRFPPSQMTLDGPISLNPSNTHDWFTGPDKEIWVHRFWRPVSRVFQVSLYFGALSGVKEKKKRANTFYSSVMLNKRRPGFLTLTKADMGDGVAGYKWLKVTMVVGNLVYRLVRWRGHF